MSLRRIIFALLLIFCITGCEFEGQPNIILIMADDMGYECVGANGSLSYSTPVLDGLAANGLRFTNTYSQPLCTPSRVKIMTGKYNYRNYEEFGYLNEKELTFGTLMRDAGYETAIVGKWQLNGLAYDLPGFDDNTRPGKFGFDEYCLWQLTVPGNMGSRYANPVIEQNGELLTFSENEYGPDIFANYIIDFVKRKREKPFFIYYPMVLVHDPFVPTPNSEEWSDPDLRLKGSKEYFADMVTYTDRIVGKIAAALEENGIDDNTILIFTGDNGTSRAISSETTWGKVDGFKGNTTNAGTRVPLIISWPEKMEEGRVYDGLIDFADFMPTLASIAGTSVESDGISFLPILDGREISGQEKIFIHYDPRWNKNVSKYRNQFARSLEYKLYQDGKFYFLPDDILEMNPIADTMLTENQLSIKRMLQEAIDSAPDWIESN